MARERAFTLVELLVTLAVAAVLAVTVIPSFSDLVRDQRLIALSNRFNASLQLARAEAIKGGWEVVICKRNRTLRCDASAGWHQGWMIFRDNNRDRHCEDGDGDGTCDGDSGEIVRASGAVTGGLAIDAGAGNTATRIVYEPTGFADGYPGTFTFCDARGIAHARGLVLSMTGRLRQADPSTDSLQCP
ncbi:GspH/FimT family pseudopilin [Spiribacter halobius]|uniref:Type II secretion system protein H n=1 Tax=Sediminicurvatus halobius TaxID=2182432 RepID=A0A2U2N8F0_9GAMM|nr:GspH/FimT family protein [Spiribacter halobius]PWG65274.1 hypothetical protein DEM34_02390 [Spiribacter halobius]UEX78904.1 GspH/FimT family pseudopilin [Spiribacter halobius]